MFVTTNFKGAEDYLSKMRKGSQVFAKDVEYRDHSGQIKQVKNYTPQHAVDMFKILKQGLVQPCFYEIILPVYGCRPHFDFDISAANGSLPEDTGIRYRLRKAMNMFNLESIDLDEVWGLASSEVTEQECRVAFQVALTSVRRLFDKGLNERPEILVLSGCRPGKISFHITCPDILMDFNVCSVAMFAWELRPITEGLVEELFALKDQVVISRLLARICVQYAMVADMGRCGGPGWDLSVYSKNRLWRLPGNEKLGKGYPLHPVDVDSICIGPEHARFNEIFNDFRVFERYLVVTVNDDPETKVRLRYNYIEVLMIKTLKKQIFSIQLSDTYPFTSVSRYYVSLYRGPNDWKSSRRVYVPPEAPVQVASRNPAMPSNKSSSYIIPSTTLVMTEYGYRVKVSDLEKGASVFCLNCDDAGFGSPAARVTLSQDGNVGIKCFGDCQKIGWSFAVWDASRMTTLDGETFTTSTLHPFITDDMISTTLPETKFFALDSGTGTGKTTWMKRVVQGILGKDPASKILLVTFRSKLASYFASSVLADLDFSDYNSDTPEVWRSTKLCCQLDSLPKIFTQKFDYVFIDEAGYVRTHAGSTIIQQRIYDVMKKLQNIITSAEKVVLLQYFLLEDDIAFFTDLQGAAAGDRAWVTRRLNSAKPLLYPTKWSSNKDVVLTTLIFRYVLIYHICMYIDTKSK